MTVIPSADPDRQMFAVELTEEPGAEARRGGERRLGNRVSFGLPAIYDLPELLRAHGAEPPYDLRTQLERYDFQLVRLVCTLHIAPSSAVSWMKIHVALEDSASDPADPPVAFDLYPVLVTDEVEVADEAKISPSLEIKGVKASLGQAGLTLKYKRLEPRIVAHGKREQEAYWRFSPGASGRVAEGIKEMDLIVRRRRGHRSRARISVQGRGQRWGIFPDPLEIGDQQFEI